MAVVFTFALQGTRYMAAGKQREYILRKEIPQQLKQGILLKVIINYFSGCLSNFKYWISC